MPVPDELSPTQRDAYDRLVAALPAGNIFELRSKPGRGRTTVLSLIRAASGGSLTTRGDFVDCLNKRHPLALEEALTEVLLDALQKHDCVIVDDFHLATAVTLRSMRVYPRNGHWNAPMSVVAAYASATGKRLIFGERRALTRCTAQCAYSFSIGRFTPDDYKHLCTGFLGESPHGSRSGESPSLCTNLNVHQLRGACSWFQRAKSTPNLHRLSADHAPASNVELGEVAEVDLRDLQGVDDVIRSLETNIVLPLEHGELAKELELQPKRGVLLSGPPGTGKTTVGRALAHRLKGKFFLIDGTFISGTSDFTR